MKINNQQQYKKFEEAIKSFDFDVQKLEIEFFTSGANNNVIGLKHSDRTWAVSISFPKTESITEEKLESFTRLQKICSYLTENFQRGIEIDENNKFIFDGNCFLCDSESTEKFIKELAGKQNYEFPSETFSYKGPFLVKKGAPASETLEHDLDFRDFMLKSLSLLHKHTGVVELVDKELVKEITENIIKELDKEIENLKPSEKTQKEIEKYNNKWNKTNDLKIKGHIVREVLIRSTKTLEELISKYTKEYGVDLIVHKGFIHGDAHGGNFIIVQNDNKKEIHPIDVEDALGLEGEEKQHYLLDLIKFTISAYNLSRILFNNPLNTDDLVETYYQHFDLSF